MTSPTNDTPPSDQSPAKQSLGSPEEVKYDSPLKPLLWLLIPFALLITYGLWN